MTQPSATGKRRGRPKGRKCAAPDCGQYFQPLKVQLMPAPGGGVQEVPYTGPPQVYCSDRCKWRAQKRAQRLAAQAQASGKD